MAFQANQLPNPLVEVDVGGHPVYQAAAKQTLKPHFQTAEPARFQRLAADAMLTVRLFDDKAGRKKQLLGKAQLCCSHLQVSIHPSLSSCSQSSRSETLLPSGSDQLQGRFSHARNLIRAEYQNGASGNLCI